MARAKFSKVLRNNYVQTVILAAILLGGVFGFWFGLKTVLQTDYPLLAVASGSMTPTLNVGDLMVVKGVVASEINAAPKPDGTIVVFHKPNNLDELIVHRVVAEVEDNETWYFQTKGDHNTIEDYWIGPDTKDGWISEKLLVGEVVSVVPWIGNVPLFVRTTEGMTLILFTFIIVILIEYIPKILKKYKT